MTASTSRAPLTTADYPLSVNRPDLLRTPTGKALVRADDGRRRLRCPHRR